MKIKQLSEIDPEQANIEYVNLTNMCYGSTPDFVDRVFIKKHFQNSFGQSYGCWIYEGNELIALNLFMCWEFIFGGEVIKAAQSVDSLVHPDYQGRGLFRKVQETCMEMIPSDVVRFGFPNGMSKPCFLKFGWKLSERYLTKIYPISWFKFAHKRYFLNQKNFKLQPAYSNQEFTESQEQIDRFFEVLTKQFNMTNFSFELLVWKLSLDKNLRVRLFKHDSVIIALLVYSIQHMDNYSLLGISDLLKLPDGKFQPLIKKEIKQLIREKAIDEVQYSGSNHEFLGELFKAVKSTSGDMIIHPHYGNKDDLDAIEYSMQISKFVTDHM